MVADMAEGTDTEGGSMDMPYSRNAEARDRLIALVREAHGEGIEIAGWLAEALGEVAKGLPLHAESLLARRPGSWEADLVRQLVKGTIGRPGTWT